MYLENLFLKVREVQPVRACPNYNTTLMNLNGTRLILSQRLLRLVYCVNINQSRLKPHVREPRQLGWTQSFYKTSHGTNLPGATLVAVKKCIPTNREFVSYQKSRLCHRFLINSHRPYWHSVRHKRSLPGVITWSYLYLLPNTWHVASGSPITPDWNTFSQACPTSSSYYLPRQNQPTCVATALADVFAHSSPEGKRWMAIAHTPL